MDHRSRRQLDVVRHVRTRIRVGIALHGRRSLCAAPACSVRPVVAIGLFDTETPLRSLRGEMIERIAAVVERGVYILGPEVRAFEEEFAAYLGVRHAIGVANGTDAIAVG